MSWHSTVYDTWFGSKRMIHTKEFLPLQKSLQLYAEFNKDTTRRSPAELTLWQYVPKALESLNFQFGTYKDHGTLPFKFDLLEIIQSIRLYTSSGTAPGGTSTTEWKGYKCRILPCGKKLRHVEAAARALHATARRIKFDKDFVCKAVRCIMKGKDEYKHGQFKSLEELEAMLNKLRLFFIPELEHLLMSSWINGERMKLERNRIIRVGMRWWYGGAFLLFKQLNGDLPNMRYFYGDVTGLDKSISDWLLLLYCCNVYPYYNWKDMSEEDKEFLENLIIYWATNVCSKMVCHVGSFWRYMSGVMPSGCKETSSGNSWIMAFIFYTYIEHMKTLYPHIADLLDAYLREMVILIVVYGDDHIWCCPERFYPYLNLKTWSAFLKEYYNMTLRDGAEFTSLLTEPSVDGREKISGPGFLKRKFIKNTIRPDLSPILPYKPLDEQMCKFYTVKYDTIVEAIMVCIGFAWDTQGTNPEAYRIIKDVYDHYMFLNPYTPVELIEQMKQAKDVPTVRRLFKKTNIRLSDMMKFPTIEEMLDRHVLDGSKANYAVSRTREDDDLFEFEDSEADELCTT